VSVADGHTVVSTPSLPFSLSQARATAGVGSGLRSRRGAHGRLLGTARLGEPISLAHLRFLEATGYQRSEFEDQRLVQADDALEKRSEERRRWDDRRAQHQGADAEASILKRSTSRRKSAGYPKGRALRRSPFGAFPILAWPPDATGGP
jgi:hypothetical protein